MAGKKGGGNTKKEAGQARKAETAAKKAAAEDAKNAAVEDADWDRGAKSNAKKEAQAARLAEQARKKAERDAALAEEEKSLPDRPGPKKSKTAVKKTNRGLDQALSELSVNDNKKLPALEGTGIENGIDLLGVALDSTDTKIDRHPERRVRAAYAVFEERRLKEMNEDGSGKGLRLNQRRNQIMREFEKSPENPLNNLHVKHNATQEEIKEVKQQAKDDTEARLASK
ncbi:DUF1014-domain-containing protein [Hypoxylon sp. NC1633]|nr:DUF1014-domain-containing protein [Hypoxylon sp. NC1633]